MTTRILVVEDNPLNFKLVRDVLEYAGYEVVGAGSGEEGLLLAGDLPPDLVLMDLQLPGIDGTETLRRLRSGVLADDVPVIALSALVMDRDHAAAETAGFDGYLNKPISVRSLPDQVASFLREQP
ncbi:response regulator [Nocardioides cynanchi]|uniref:response regulator n=1 Tax=Nocardioides cynanchi TaxID=2558918 RepID=UPI001244CF86|nr:response regulator [Nocardioides cynanchi]